MKAALNYFLSALVASAIFMSTESTAVETTEVVRTNIRGAVVALTKFDNSFEGQMFWGEFASSPGSVERFHYHFFPDKKFIVTVSCDLCPQTPIAEGVFVFTHGKIQLKYSRKKGRHLLTSPLYVLHGYDNPGGDTDKKYEIIVLDSNNYSMAMRGKKEFDFIRRVEPYRDWKGIYARLKEREKSYGPMMAPDGFPKIVPPK